MGRTATECEWLKEFPCQIWRPDVKDKKIIAWDWLPQDWMADERFFQYDHWFENEAMQEGHVKEEYDRVIGSSTSFSRKHGYERKGHYYKVNEENNDTIIFLLSFWIGVCTSQPSAEYHLRWYFGHGCVAAPSSVTTLTTEERRQGIAASA